MTEPEFRTEPPTATGEPRDLEPHGRYHWRRRGRPFRLAAMVVTLAGIVFIVAVIFWSGFILGACSGGHHGRRGGEGHESMSSLYAPAPASDGVHAA
jgi:hypothetical protein